MSNACLKSTKSTYNLPDRLSKYRCTKVLSWQKCNEQEVLYSIREAKKKYKDKVVLQFNSGDLTAVWHGIKTMSSVNCKVNAVKQPVTLAGVDKYDLSKDNPVV